MFSNRAAALLQGIKFYEPEVVGATPEAVEYQGMRNLLAAVKEHVGYRQGKLIFSAHGQVGCSHAKLLLPADGYVAEMASRVPAHAILFWSCMSVNW